MKLSLQWINEFVKIDDYFSQPEVLAEKLTRAGLEVEEITNRRKDYEHVVVGLILEKDKHPNADKLSLCRVTTGEGVIHQIVCGAQNHKSGDRVIVALPGAILPGNFQIKLSSIRGVESSGMLCSLKELALAEESQGIEILPAEAKIGTSFADYKGLNDITFELKVTPNRADCLSHFGLAREIACLLGREIQAPTPQFEVSSQSTKNEFFVEVKSPELCPRYTGHYISNVTIKPSPEWMKLRLESVGMKSINNVVDITNYVMLEYGQPLHAFDADQIQGRKVIVDLARPDEEMISLEGTSLALKARHLTIRDSSQVLCIAGVIGGQKSGVSDSTKNIFLEAAFFTPQVVRQASRDLGVETDSAYRFSRGVDPDSTFRAARRAVELISQLAGGVVHGDPYDIYPSPVEKKVVRVKSQNVSGRLGYVIDEKLLLDYMKRIGAHVKVIQAAAAPSTGAQQVAEFELELPLFRFDLESEIDLVEEYARLAGYDLIPENLPVFAKAPTAHDKNYILNRKTARVFMGEGYFQAFNFAFVNGAEESQFLGQKRRMQSLGLSLAEEPIKLLNPLNEQVNSMRSCLSYGLFQNVLTNFRKGNHFGRLFEVGSSFQKDGPELYKENLRLGLAAWGQVQNLWTQDQKHPLIFEVKASLEQWLKQQNISAFSWVTPSDRSSIPQFCHIGQFAELVVEGQKVGYLSTVHPTWLDDHKIRETVVLAEVNLEALYKGQPRPSRFMALSQYPSVERDFAFVMPKTVRAADIIKVMKQIAGTLLVKTDVFDLYEGDKLPKGQKSVAFRLTFQDQNVTLQDKTISDLQQKLVEGLEKQLGLTLR
jgi:phenylalanyl-tRNA synthetase beta chain